MPLCKKNKTTFRTIPVQVTLHRFFAQEEESLAISPSINKEKNIAKATLKKKMLTDANLVCYICIAYEIFRYIYLFIHILLSFIAFFYWMGNEGI